MVVDYWLVRKQELDVPELYRPNGKYKGTNLVAVVALVLGIIPNLPGFLKVAGAIDSVPAIFETIYTYAWFIGFFVSGGLYYLGTLLAGKED